MKFHYKEHIKVIKICCYTKYSLQPHLHVAVMSIRPRINSDIFANTSLELMAMWESRNQGITKYCASLKLQVNHGGQTELSMWTEQQTGFATVRIAMCYIKEMVQQTDLTWVYSCILLSKHQDCKDALLATVFTNVSPLLTSTPFARVTILK